jgi:hypothetical protein
MWFPHFRRQPEPQDNPRGDDLDASRSWRDSGLADEIELFLRGRLVEHMTVNRRPVPAWAVLNRLAHADRSELVRLVEGVEISWITHPSTAQPYWAPAERFVAGHMLARARTPEELGRLQRAALVPLELGLIERATSERLTADQVLEMGAEALDSFHPGR